MRRTEIIKEIKQFIEPNKNILAAYEGGSQATGYTDEFSDLDLVIITDKKHKEHTFKKIETFLDNKYGMKTKFRLDEPTWHKHSQAFYLLEKVPEYFYVDLLIVEKNSYNQFLEIERHGKPFIWFDKENLLNIKHVDKTKIDKKIKQRYRILKTVNEITLIEIYKNIARDNFIDAMINYHRLLNRQLSFFLNLKYRPLKYDFGLLYAYRAYPKEINNQLNQFMKISNMKDLKRKTEKIENLSRNLIKELDDKYN